MTRVLTIAVEGDDTDLDGLANLLESKLQALFDEIRHTKVISVQVTPANAHYSRDAGGGSYREYHYNESGLIAIVVYEEKR